MIYAINLLYTELITYLIGVLYGGKKLSLASFLFIISPVLLLWLLIAGGQLNVGTDYNSYMELFNGGDLSRYEPGFIYILSYVQDYGFHGQFFYYLFYGIGFIFLGSILYHLNPKNLYIFIFIFLTFTGLFHNQLNILRQAIATYIGTYGVIMSVNGKKLTAIMMFLFASSIHFCALIFFFFGVYKTHFFT